MFLWVKLVLEIVQDQQSLKDLKAAVDRLPKGLDGVYAILFPKFNALLIPSQL